MEQADELGLGSDDEIFSDLPADFQNKIINALPK